MAPCRDPSAGPMCVIWLWSLLPLDRPHLPFQGWGVPHGHVVEPMPWDALDWLLCAACRERSGSCMVRR